MLATFVSKFVAMNFKKSPNQVTLLASEYLKLLICRDDIMPLKCRVTSYPQIGSLVHVFTTFRLQV